MADNIQTVISQSESVLMAGFESSFRASHFMILFVLFWASTLPTWGKHVTQHGQARCPKWADFISCLCPKSLSKTGHWVVFFMTAFIITDIVITWWRCVHGLRQGHKSKKNETRIGFFTVPFFDDIELMILGFWFWI